MLVIDTFNLLHQTDVLPSALLYAPSGKGVRGELAALVALIDASRYARQRVRLVCDGAGGPGTLEGHHGLRWTRIGRAEVVYSGPSLEADDVIEDMLARSRGAVKLRVVSGDRRLVKAAARAKAESIDSRVFLAHLDADHRQSGHDLPAFATEVPLDRYSVAHWMREFGYAVPDPATIEPTPPPIPQPTPKPKSKPKPKSAPSTPVDTPSTKVRSKKSTPPPEVPDAPVESPAEVASPPEPLDPLLAEAFDHWRGTLHLDDLDMSQWIDGVTPLPPRRRSDPDTGRRSDRARRGRTP